MDSMNPSLGRVRSRNYMLPTYISAPDQARDSPYGRRLRRASVILETNGAFRGGLSGVSGLIPVPLQSGQDGGRSIFT